MVYGSSHDYFVALAWLYLVFPRIEIAEVIINHLIVMMLLRVLHLAVPDIDILSVDGLELAARGRRHLIRRGLREHGPERVGTDTGLLISIVHKEGVLVK